MAAVHLPLVKGQQWLLSVTHISASAASLVRMVIEWRKFGRPSVLGMVTEMGAGLATVTRASGFIGIPGEIILGLVGGYLCYVAVDITRNKFAINNSLDVFAVHGLGGILGKLLLSVLATASFSGLRLPNGVSISDQFMVQLHSVGIAVGWTALISFVIL